ncbi:MAG: hypothetical protein RL494_1694 [Bacteroidota bacterium]|jgi:hypothetical protein
MKIKFLVPVLFFVYSFSNAQIETAIIGRWKLSTTVETEFTTTEMANKQVVENKAKYAFLENGKWNFKKGGLFEVKLENGKKETGRYTAQENRFIIIFDNQEIEEFNSTNCSLNEKTILVSFGRGMTKLKFTFSN